ncbi:MAG: hypothetical protein A3I79_06290 [Gemmatimonadetes bacterium RIFCSPLOWO2_02_FULL_71_11]|nr:MAG: hypothetical protein A3I79_06290 [Gemmatimonadetes bacterium RIFCSPLOWO2_02_FULL_71_11]
MPFSRNNPVFTASTSVESRRSHSSALRRAQSGALASANRKRAGSSSTTATLLRSRPSAVRTSKSPTRSPGCESRQLTARASSESRVAVASGT